MSRRGKIPNRPYEVDWVPTEIRNTEEVKELYSLFTSPNQSDRDVAIGISENYKSHRLHISMWTDDLTITVLDFCTPYYEWIAIREMLPGSKPKEYWDNGSIRGIPWPRKHKGLINGYPALWIALEKVNLRRNCGSSHQYYIGPTALTTGLYANRNGEWFKQILYL